MDQGLGKHDVGRYGGFGGKPSGLWGALKEAFASSSALAAAKSNSGSNELIKAVVAEFETKGGEPQSRKHCASTSPEPLSLLTLFSVRSLI